MKPRFSPQRNQALTFIEVLVVIAVLAILAALLFFPFSTGMKIRAPRINCVSNLKQVDLALRIWEADNNKQYPMGISVTNGGGRELIQVGNVAGCLQAASNELSTTKILICPADTDHTYATNFQDLSSSHISYFLGVDVTNEDNPQMVLDGDDNLAIGSMPVKSGSVELTTNTPVSWTKERHHFCGNIGFADGSVAEESTLGLQHALQETGLATNRIAIP